MSDQISRTARRGFLRSLASLPLVGGSVTLIGSPTRADVPVTDDLLHTYDTFLDFERRYLNWERARGDRETFRGLMGHTYLQNPAASFDYAGQRGGLGPSDRAALILSAAGCGWEAGQRRAGKSRN